MAGRILSNKIKSRKRGRNVSLNRMAASAVAAQQEAFKHKFGRALGPNDPVFFDPSASTPQPLPTHEGDRQIALALEKAGIDPAIVYAFKKTGELVTELNYDLIPKDRLRAYEAALEEFDRMQASPK